MPTGPIAVTTTPVLQQVGVVSDIVAIERCVGLFRVCLIQASPYYVIHVAMQHRPVGARAARVVIDDDSQIPAPFPGDDTCPVNKFIKELGGRPHLGKYCKGFDAEYLQKLHGEYFETFQRLMVQHDPAGTFSNAFTERLFGPNTDLADTSTSATR